MNVEIFCAFETRLDIANILVPRDNALQLKRIYYKKMKVPFSSTMLRYFVTSSFL